MENEFIIYLKKSIINIYNMENKNENENEMSSVMIRYFQNKDKYNTRAKKYFNEVYYPQHKAELLKKGKEYRQLKKIYYVKKERVKKEHVKKELKEKVLNHSLTVSFD
jgi:hypothetical protein